MRISSLFGETLRRAPADALLESHRWLMRAGYMRQLAPGLFSYLPLGLRVKRKLESVLRDEMDRIGGQEIAMPLVQPAQLWSASGWPRLGGAELGRFTDRSERPLVLATSHEQVAVELARTEIRSHRQTPALLYQIQTVFRDEQRPQSGLIRAREFTLLASYAFDRDPNAARERYYEHQRSFMRVFRRLQLPNVVVAEAAVVGSAELLAHECVWLGDVGDNEVAICNSCGYAAKRDVARFRKPGPPVERPKSLEKVATPGADTIESLAAFLGVTAERTAKVVFFSTHTSGSAHGPGLVMALVRGDMEVSESKLKAVLKADRLEPAEPAAIRGAGAEPGFASPVGIESAELLVVVDDLVATTPNLISGANESGYHFRNVNFRRDYDTPWVSDIARAPSRAACRDCASDLRVTPGVEVASLHQFGPALPGGLEATYQDETGTRRALQLSSYGIGVDRLLACLAEVHHDDRGLRLPAVIAPYQIHLVALGGDPEVRLRADALYADLRSGGHEVLYDDRDLGAGAKFTDADLIGAPLRLTIGPRSLQDASVELKRRDSEDRLALRFDALPATLATILTELEASSD